MGPKATLTIALCLSTGGALAQANGDPGASLEGQLAAQRADRNAKPSPDRRGAGAPVEGGSVAHKDADRQSAGPKR